MTTCTIYFGTDQRDHINNLLDQLVNDCDLDSYDYDKTPIKKNGEEYLKYKIKHKNPWGLFKLGHVLGMAASRLNIDFKRLHTL